MKLIVHGAVKCLLGALLFNTMVAYACGPSPQKVVEEVVIHATPEQVWAVAGNFAQMGDWHPSVVASRVESKLNEDGTTTHYRVLTLKNGGQLTERLRPIKEGVMKLGAVIEKGDMPVSNYSDALTVKPGSTPLESVVTWTGRFNNKANLLVAPKGEDNEAAKLAVNQFYKAGLNNLKHLMEMSLLTAH